MPIQTELSAGARPPRTRLWRSRVVLLRSFPVDVARSWYSRRLASPLMSTMTRT